ncbi:hypothetical protein PGB90_007116 [Kerria lacca]
MGKESFRLKSCCGIFSIRIGSLIILSINLICGCFLITAPHIFNKVRNRTHSLNFMKPASYYLNDNNYKRTTTTPRVDVDVKKLSEELSLNYEAIEVFFTWAVPTGLSVAFTSGLALYGVFKEKPMFVLPFILCSTFISFLLAVVEISVTRRQFLTCTVAYLILHSEIFAYLILVVFTHYRTLAGYVQEV